MCRQVFGGGIPLPKTMLHTPLGKPALLSTVPSMYAVSGVSSEGLATTVFPTANAGAIFQVNRYKGKFLVWDYF